MHSYKDTKLPNPTFDCAVKFTDDSIIIMIQDKGKFFDRSAVPAPSLEANLKGERRGGFGVFLVEKLMDKVSYIHENGINTVIIEKRIQ